VVDDGDLYTIKRRAGEPKLKVGETVAIKDGVTGTVLARYTPSRHRDEIHYIVQVQADKHGKRRH
jgi:hypothetical protein